MKLLLFKLVVCCAAVLAAPADKEKRDILPGDPRYGTDNHQEHQAHDEHHEHHANENEVQPQPSYGPPNHVPSKPLGTDEFAINDADKTPASILVPATSYGIPDSTQVIKISPKSFSHSGFLFGDFFGPTFDEKTAALIKTTIQESPKFDTVHVHKSATPEVHHDVLEKSAVVHKTEHTPKSISLPQAKTTTSHVPTEIQGVFQHDIPTFTSAFGGFPSYVSYPSYPSYSNIPVKTLDHHVQVKVPHPYHVPVTKHVQVPVPVPHTVEVPKPYYVRVPQPVQVTVNRPYPVEVPRAVPYPVHHYVKTAVPTIANQHHLILDTKASPFQTFYENIQSTFQNPPSFPNPFENIDLSSYVPSFPNFIPSLGSFIPSPQPAPATADHVNVFSSGDSITVDNPVLKTKPTVVQPIITHHTKTHTKGSSTACAGCIVTSASNKQNHVQPTDANGAYVY
ncbi:PREDICTED: uncharacterized protein LOC105563516 [Vollenhovia emeryi]|uniref:uncharacterized protein LOC105563516 n=1 Tax=Vollenhovia emeryi TaxID=411798 RepID=UPI0005F38C52|nr:PREDICTED: uncharacterized protein LOC105563516 [Vollenhovia emeryi]